MPAQISRNFAKFSEAFREYSLATKKFERFEELSYMKKIIAAGYADYCLLKARFSREFRNY